MASVTVKKITIKPKNKSSKGKVTASRATINGAVAKLKANKR